MTYYPLRAEGMPHAVPEQRPANLMQSDNGLYYRYPPLPPEIDLSSAGELQRWVEEGWKTPHFSPESVTRFTDKHLEEMIELVEAVSQYRATPSAETRTALLGECADVSFTNVALMSNAGVNLHGAIDVYAHAPIAISARGETQASQDKRQLEQLWDGERRVADSTIQAVYDKAGFGMFAANVPSDPFNRLNYNAVVMVGAARLIGRALVEKSVTPDVLLNAANEVIAPLGVDNLAQIGQVVKEAGATPRELLEPLRRKIADRIGANALDKTDPGRIT